MARPSNHLELWSYGAMEPQSCDVDGDLQTILEVPSLIKIWFKFNYWFVVMSMWFCTLCTLANDSCYSECVACGCPNQSTESCSTSSSSNNSNYTNQTKKSKDSAFTVECSLCTYLNTVSVATVDCTMCGAPLPTIHHLSTENARKVSKKSVIYDFNEDEDDEDPSDRLYAILNNNFNQFVEVDDDGQLFRCKIDGKVCRTKALMTAYLVKTHPLAIEKLQLGNNSVSKDSGDDEVVIRGKKSPRSTTIFTSSQDYNYFEGIDSNTVIGSSDHEIALRLAMQEYDEQHGKSTKSIKNKSRRERVGCDSLATASGERSRKKDKKNENTKYKSRLLNDNLESEEELTLEEEIVDVTTIEMKSIRLQKLLKKTDKLLQRINGIMNRNSIAVAKTRSQIGGEDLSSMLSVNLRDYQYKGVKWLLSLHANGLNGILADEMGLGKTIQVIAFLAKLYDEYQEQGPHLIVMPLSVITSWKSDFLKFVPHCHFTDPKTILDTEFSKQQGTCSSSSSSSSSYVDYDMEIYVHHGEKNDREEAFDLWKRDLKRRMGKSGNKRTIFICLSTYELAMKDNKFLKKLSKGSYGWKYLVVDEAHRLKNNLSLLYSCLSHLKPEKRLLLSGTPLQNNLNELWALLNFILPKMFDNGQQFNDWFNKPFESEDEDEGNNDQVPTDSFVSDSTDASIIVNINTSVDRISDISTVKRRKRSKKYRSNIASGELSAMLSLQEKQVVITSLHRVLKPFLLRRVKLDVAKDLPPKIERIVFCPQSDLQIKLHRLLMSAALESKLTNKKENIKYDSDLERNYYKKQMSSLQNILMQLRKLCNHPYLLLEEMLSIPDNLYDKYLINSCGKLAVLDKLLDHLLQNNSKVIIFSQMTAMLTILEGYLYYHKGIIAARLDGGTDRTIREVQLTSFNDPNNFEYSVFLISTRAGGVGINLQAADTVIIYDSDWNPQQDLQAISRAHRIGQTKPVLVLRLITLGHDTSTTSVEQKILKRATKKLEAGKMILADGKFHMGTVSDSVEEMEFDRIIEEGLTDTEVINDSDNGSVEIKISSTEDVATSKEQDIVTIYSSNDFSSNGILHCCRRSIEPVNIGNLPVVERSGNELNLMKLDKTAANDWEDWLSDTSETHKLQRAASVEEARNNFESKGFSSRRKSFQSLDEDTMWKKIIDESDLDESPKKKRRTASRSNSSLDKNGRTDRSIGKKLFSTTATGCKIKNENTSTTRSSDDHDDGGNAIADDDICVLCQRAWVTTDDLSIYHDFFRQALKNKNILNSLSDREATNLPASSIDSNPIIDPETLIGKDMMNVMILCDGCDGSYHMICVGLTEVPEDDWFCQYCVETNS